MRAMLEQESALQGEQKRNDEVMYEEVESGVCQRWPYMSPASGPWKPGQMRLVPNPGQVIPPV